MSDGISAPKAGFLATKKRSKTVIARLHYKDLLLLYHNKVILIQVNRLRTIEEKSLELQNINFSVIFGQSSSKIKYNEGPRRDGQKHFRRSLVYDMSCISNVIVEFRKYEFNRWSKMVGSDA